MPITSQGWRGLTGGATCAVWGGGGGGGGTSIRAGGTASSGSSGEALGGEGGGGSAGGAGGAGGAGVRRAPRSSGRTTVAVADTGGSDASAAVSAPSTIGTRSEAGTVIFSLGLSTVFSAVFGCGITLVTSRVLDSRCTSPKALLSVVWSWIKRDSRGYAASAVAISLSAPSRSPAVCNCRACETTLFTYSSRLRSSSSVRRL